MILRLKVNCGQIKNLASKDHALRKLEVIGDFFRRELGLDCNVRRQEEEDDDLYVIATVGLADEFRGVLGEVEVQLGSF